MMRKRHICFQRTPKVSSLPNHQPGWSDPLMPGAYPSPPPPNNDRHHDGMVRTCSRCFSLSSGDEFSNGVTRGGRIRAKSLVRKLKKIEEVFHFYSPLITNEKNSLLARVAARACIVRLRHVDWPRPPGPNDDGYQGDNTIGVI